MRRIATILIAALFVSSCREKDDVKPAEDEPVVAARGTLSFYINSYDSLGGLQQDAGGIKINLVQSGQSAITNSSGDCTFNDVPYGFIAPVITREGYEGPPAGIDFNSPSKSVSLPCPQRSTYKILNLTGSSLSEDSVNITFSFDKPVPAGKFCRIAVISSTNTAMTPNSFGTADIITTVSQNNTINISQLPAFKAALASLPKNSGYFVSAVAVSYGLFESNLTGKPVLLGENLFYPDNLTFYKTW